MSMLILSLVSIFSNLTTIRPTINYMQPYLTIDLFNEFQDYHQQNEKHEDPK